MSGTLQHAENNVTIEVRPRIHLGLISMHADAVRRNGGIGFAVADPSAVVKVNAADQFRLRDERAYPFAASEIEQLEAAIKQAMEEDHLRFDVDVCIRGRVRTHIGMGSGTALRLGILEGIYTLNGIAASRELLVRKSRRGGTSGIGIHTYFSGGMILDLGVPRDGAPFVPSSRADVVRSPTALPRLVMPAWALCLCVPKSIPSKTQEQEAEFFARTAPLSPAGSFRAAYEAVFNVYASVLEGDYASFCWAVEAMQQTEWKTKEWLEYGVALQTLKLDLLRLGADCVGMSSLGPMLFCMGNSSALGEIANQESALDCDVICTEPCNRGRTMSRTDPCAN